MPAPIIGRSSARAQGQRMFDSPNHLDVTQFVVLGLSLVLSVLSLRAYRRSPSMRGFALSLFCIGLISVAFYLVVIMTQIDELYPDIVAFASGIRSAFVYTVLCGVAWMWVRFYNEKSHE
jgi:hypothetical protein